MKSFAISLLAASVSAFNSSRSVYFTSYLAEHNKAYDTVEEFNKRFDIFMAFDAVVEAINADERSTFKAAHNKFSDWTKEEFEKTLGLKNTINGYIQEIIDDWYESDKINTEIDLPESWSWRDQGMTSPVKDQGYCGSCWAISAIDAVESAWMIAGNSPVNFSAQQLLDCSERNYGCTGGMFNNAYEYLKENKTMNASDYPYTGKQGECKNDQSKGVAQVATYDRAIGTKQNLAQLYRQPLNVAVAAGNDAFRSYSSGILTDTSHCGQDVDHAALAVGWGEEDGVQYYIVRNSWGTKWGEDGYVRIATGGVRGVCGINQFVFYPTVY